MLRFISSKCKIEFATMNVYGILCFAGIFASVTCVCQDGWMRHGSTCYHFSHDTEDWPGALTMCDVIGGSLVEIDGPQKNHFLTSQVNILNKHFWIGLSDVVQEGYWVWMVSKAKLQTGSYSNWSPGEPNNDGKNENCGDIYPTGKWNDAECYMPKNYICEQADESSEIIG